MTHTQFGRNSLGIVEFNPIQYRIPIYQRLEQRNNISFDVLFLNDHGHQPSVDPGFGVTVAWDIDLLSGYAHDFLTSTEHPLNVYRRLRKLTQWLINHSVIIVQGHSNPWMLAVILICRLRGIPYILRSCTQLQGRSTGIRQHLRNSLVRMVVSHSAGGLAYGQLNETFYRKYNAPRIVSAPYSVNNERFARTPDVKRSQLLARWGLDESLKVIMFSGKLVPNKRPLDLITAVQLLDQEVNTIFVGDGSMADQVRSALKPGRGAVTGFINQNDLPMYYHAADILVLPSAHEKWGAVVNEAMATGALPVVSDGVGAAPDLVSGLGEVYPCGDIVTLAGALNRALTRIESGRIRSQIREHVARHSVDKTVDGFEQIVMSVMGQHRAPRD